MDSIEQKEKDTIELKKLTKFQKKQVLSLVDRFLEENEESKKEVFPACPKCGKAHPVLTKAGKTKGGKRVYLCHEYGRRFVEDIGRLSNYSWREFMEDTLQGKTLDESANRLGISHSMAWSCRHKIME